MNEIAKKKEELSDNEPHTMSELICVACLERGYHVYHHETLLKDIECDKCREIGYLIMTGQEINED